MGERARSYSVARAVKVRHAADDGAFKRPPVRFPRGLHRHSARLSTVRVRPWTWPLWDSSEFSLSFEVANITTSQPRIRAKYGPAKIWSLYFFEYASIIHSV